MIYGDKTLSTLDKVNYLYRNEVLDNFISSKRKENQDKMKNITEEIFYIKNQINCQSKYLRLGNITKFYFENSSIKVGSVRKTFDFVSGILRCYGYSDEEVSRFFIRNFRIILSNYEDFRTRLAIFNHVGLLDDALFKGYFLLSVELDNNFGINTNRLYAIMMSGKFETIDELKHLIESTTLGKLKEILPIHQLNYKTRVELDDELISTLISKNIENTPKLSK